MLSVEVLAAGDVDADEAAVVVDDADEVLDAALKGECAADTAVDEGEPEAGTDIGAGVLRRR